MRHGGIERVRGKRRGDKEKRGRVEEENKGKKRANEEDPGRSLGPTAHPRAPQRAMDRGERGQKRSKGKGEEGRIIENQLTSFAVFNRINFPISHL